MAKAAQKSKSKKSGREPGNLPEKVANIPANVQYDLFTQFYGDAGELSNTIELWDAIPKYSVTPRRQNAMRSKDGRLSVYSYTFAYRNKWQCKLEMQPASIKLEDGSYKDFYPSQDEELVEEVLRKIFADQRFGYHDTSEPASWVAFSLTMINDELKSRGKSRSYDEIKRSIEILSKTHITLFIEGQEKAVYRSTILSDVIEVGREHYLGDSSARWLARLPALISKSLSELSYRQFNYGKLMKMHNQLAWWLHKKLSHNYTNASIIQPYNILFSTIQRDSGLLAHPRKSANIKALEKALEDLRHERVAVLNHWTREERRGPDNRIEDILYTLYAHPDFVNEVKAANARQKKNVEALGQEKPASRKRS